MVTKLYVDTVGDSTLENRYWHMNGTGTNLGEAIQKSVEGQLQNQLVYEYEVVSHAYDGFTTQDVLEGGTIWAVFPWGGLKVDAYVKSKRTYAFGTYSPVHVKPLEN